MLRTIDGVIRRRREIGPVRLDVGQMHQPRLVAGLAHEFHRAIGDVGRFRMLFLHARRQARVAHVPARHQLAVRRLRTVGIFVPGIVTHVSMRMKVSVIGQIGRHELIGMLAVVALPRLETAFGHEQPDIGLARQAEPRHAIDVAAKMRLARNGDAYAMRLQVIAERHLPDRQRDEVPRRAMREHRAPRIERGARGPAHGRLHEGFVEPYAKRRETVDVRCLQMRMSRAGQVIPAQLVAHDEQDILDGAHC
jgi:hypothetical protein